MIISFPNSIKLQYMRVWYTVVVCGIFYIKFEISPLKIWDFNIICVSEFDYQTKHSEEICKTEKRRVHNGESVWTIGTD